MTVMSAWQGANLAGCRKLPSLEELLNPPTKADRRRGLLDMFRRMKERGDEVRDNGLQGA